ncbi:MAG: histidinol-phosphatase HisJ [Deltaproteobacteria bacterium]|nr:histidinol-phosphatase HisJ [Deltaproteobacteria bacterium]
MHSEYAPHGSPSATEAFLQHAAALGFTRVTLAEHAPLPDGFSDPTPEHDGNLDADRLEPYLRHAAEVRERWRGRLEVLVGLEIDLLPGHEDHARILVERHAAVLDEVVASLHLLPLGRGEWGSTDYSPETFAESARRCGSVAALRRRYLETLAEQIDRDAGAPLPRRLGHPLLIDKFQRLFPSMDPLEDSLAEAVVAAAADRGWSLDLNAAGLRKPHCGTLYLRGPMLTAARRLAVPVVYGSDAHRPDEVGAGWSEAVTEFEKAGYAARRSPGPDRLS